MIGQLPDTSATAASIQGGREFRGWGVDRHIAADRLDVFVAANTSKGKKAQKYPRPIAKKKAQARTLRSTFPGR